MRSLFALCFALCLVLGACSGGGGDDPLGPGPADDTPAGCAPLQYDKRVPDMESSLTLTIDGTAIPLRIDPDRVVRSTDAGWIITPIRSACAQVKRVVQRADGGWTKLAFWAALTNDDGAVVMSLGYVFGALFVQVRHEGVDYEFFDNRPLPSQAPTVPGQPVVLQFDGLSEVLNRLDDRYATLPFSLDGELRFTAPPYAPDGSVTTPVKDLHGCDPADSRLLDVTADRPDLLPFTGGCWDQGNTYIGNGVQIGFRAEPEDAPARVLEIVPWVITFHLAIAAEGAHVLQIVPPDGVVDQLNRGPMRGQAQSFIEYSRDGVYGHDWVAVDGTIIVHDLSLNDGEPVIDAEFDVTYRFLGPADMDPSLDGEDVQVTGKLKVEARRFD